MTDPLASAVMGAPDVGRRNTQLRYGTVTQVSPLLVKVGAATVGQPCNKVASYVPVLGEYVSVLVQGPDRVVIAAMTPGWHTWVPTVTQSGNVTLAVVTASYFRMDRTVFFEAVLIVTGSGSANNPVRISLPFPGAARYGTATHIVGTGMIQDVTGATKDYSGPLTSVSTGLVDISTASTTGSTGTNDRLGQAGFTAALAAGDAIEVHGFYESATS